MDLIVNNNQLIHLKKKDNNILIQNLTYIMWAKHIRFTKY